LKALPLRKLSSVGDHLSWSHAAELSWLCAGQAVSLALGIITIKLLASMGPSEYGTYALVGTIGALVSAVLYGPFEQGFVRFYYDYASQGMANRFIHLFHICLMVGAIFCLVGGSTVLIANVWIDINLPPLLIATATFFVLLSCSSNPFNPMLNVLRKRKENAIFQILERLLGLLLLLGVFQLMGRTVCAALLSISVALGLVVMGKSIMLFSLQPDARPSGADQQKGLYVGMLTVVRRFGAPFAVWGLAGWLQSSSERWVILAYLSAADVGLYAVMMALATYAVAVPLGILSQFATPFIYERFAASACTARKREGAIYLRYLVLSSALLVAVVSLAALVVGKSAIVLLSSEKYASYWYLLPLLCLGTGFFQVGQALSLVGLALNVPNRYMFPKVASGVFAVLLNLLLLNLFGLLGIALSVCAAGLTYLVLIAAVNMKIRAEMCTSEAVAT
jgi:O-antigen/teichoic acid export membrane protein